MDQLGIGRRGQVPSKENSISVDALSGSGEHTGTERIGLFILIVCQFQKKI